MNYLVNNNQDGLTIQFNLNGHPATLSLSYLPHPISKKLTFFVVFMGFVDGENVIKSTGTPFLPYQFERIVGDVLSFTTNKKFEKFLDILYQCYLDDVMDVFYERYVSRVRLIKNANY